MANYIQIRPRGERAWLIVGDNHSETTLQDLFAELIARHQDEDDDGIMEIQFAQYTKEELLKVGEFDGW